MKSASFTIPATVFAALLVAGCDGYVTKTGNLGSSTYEVKLPQKNGDWDCAANDVGQMACATQQQDIPSKEGWKCEACGSQDWQSAFSGFGDWLTKRPRPDGETPEVPLPGQGIPPIGQGDQEKPAPGAPPIGKGEYKKPDLFGQGDQEKDGRGSLDEMWERFGNFGSFGDTKKGTGCRRDDLPRGLHGCKLGPFGGKVICNKKPDVDLPGKAIPQPPVPEPNPGKQYPVPEPDPGQKYPEPDPAGQK